MGKTTLACATAFAPGPAVSGQKKFCSISTDPAHSLAACLEVEPWAPSRSARLPGLTALEIDAPASSPRSKKQFRQELEGIPANSPRSTIYAVPFDRQVMERMLDLSPPGLDEVMALARRSSSSWHRASYDLLVLDSAPTGHLLRLLELPELVDQWLKSLFGLLLKYKLTFRFPDISQQLVRISRNLKQLRNLWRDPSRSALYAVTILTEMAFQETRDLLAVCGRLGVPAPVLLLNLATPAWDCPLCTSLNRREALIRNKFQQTFPGHQTVIYRQSEPRGRKRLGELGQALYRSRFMEKRHGAVAHMPALSK